MQDCRLPKRWHSGERVQEDLVLRTSMPAGIAWRSRSHLRRKVTHPGRPGILEAGWRGKSSDRHTVTFPGTVRTGIAGSSTIRQAPRGFARQRRKGGYDDIASVISPAGQAPLHNGACHHKARSSVPREGSWAPSVSPGKLAKRSPSGDRVQAGVHVEDVVNAYCPTRRPSHRNRHSSHSTHYAEQAQGQAQGISPLKSGRCRTTARPVLVDVRGPTSTNRCALASE
jgi:hypothetical protein